MRFVIICLLILAAFFAGHAIYYRSKTVDLLNQALNQMVASPAMSFRILEPALTYNNAMTLGKTNEARRTYVKVLQQRTLGLLNNPTPAGEDFDRAFQAVRVLNEFQQKTFMDTRPARIAIMQAAKDAVPRIEQQGTLQTWNAMLNFFKGIHESEQIPSSVFDNYGAWIAKTMDVPQRPMGVREGIANASRLLGDAVRHLGMETSTNSPGVVAASPGLSDTQLIEAERGFTQAQAELVHFQEAIGDAQLSPEFIALYAKLCYNKAAIKLAHFQDHGPAIRTVGSNYMAELLIRSDTTTVPTAAEMVGAFIQGAQGDFEQAQTLFGQAGTLTEPMRRAYAALAAGSELLLLRQMAGGESPGLVQKFNAWSSGLTGPAADIPKAMLASQRVLLIVQAP